MERRQELEAQQAKARRQLREASNARSSEGPGGPKGWFKRRLDGRQREKQARQNLRRIGKKLEGLPPERALKKQVGKDLQSLAPKERQRLEKALPEAQRELASRAVRAAQKAVRERSTGREGRDRGRGGISMGM